MQARCKCIEDRCKFFYGYSCNGVGCEAKVFKTVEGENVIARVTLKPSVTAGCMTLCFENMEKFKGEFEMIEGSDEELREAGGLRIKSKPGNKKYANCTGKVYKNYNSDSKAVFASLWFKSGYHVLEKYNSMKFLLKYFDIIDDD